jgi:hypothetical protein
MSVQRCDQVDELDNIANPLDVAEHAMIGMKDKRRCRLTLEETSPLFVGMHPLVRCDFLPLSQFNHPHRW